MRRRRRIRTKKDDQETHKKTQRKSEKKSYLSKRPNINRTSLSATKILRTIWADRQPDIKSAQHIVVWICG